MNLLKGDWIRLGDLRPGAIFMNGQGIMAVKSEYYYSSGTQCQCVLLASGEYAHFDSKDDEQVIEIEIEM